MLSLPFSRNRSRPASDLMSIQAESRHRSLALPRLVTQCEETSPLRVLDLGRAVDSNMRFFTPYDARLTVADLFDVCRSRGLAHLPDDEDAIANKRERIFREALPYDPDQRFDLVLAWDLLNYLSPADLEGLMERLKKYCRPGTMLFSLIATRKEIPIEPRPFSLVGPDEILYREASKRVRPCPRYNEQDLLRRLKGFRVDSRYLLRNGMQEYLFVYGLSG